MKLPPPGFKQPIPDPSEPGPEWEPCEPPSDAMFDFGLRARRRWSNDDERYVYRFKCSCLMWEPRTDIPGWWNLYAPPGHEGGCTKVVAPFNWVPNI